MNDGRDCYTVGAIQLIFWTLAVPLFCLALVGLILWIIGVMT